MGTRDGIRQLVDALAAAHPARLSRAVNESLSGEGDMEATIWLSDVSATRLTDLSGESTPQSMEGSRAGRSYRNLETIVSQEHLLTPLQSLGRVLGVLELRGSALTERAEEMQTAARVITDRLIGAKGHSDVVEQARGGGNLGLAATIQYDLMPIPSYMGDEVEIGGWIEPAYDIAGDAWDYAVNTDEVDFGIFDSVGHGLRSCQLSMIALGSFRLARRRGGSLPDIAASIEEGLKEVAVLGEFITGTVGRALPGERKLELANAGHLAPIRIRDGKPSRLEWKPALPFGLDGKNPSIHTFEIQPGDSFYLFSDGVIEAMDHNSARFGIDTLSDLLRRANAEERTVSAICHEVLDSVSTHVGGPLRDDATVLGVRFL
jgi:serine phosphatase RsbU (regulator of sigma subunit)